MMPDSVEAGSLAREGNMRFQLASARWSGDGRTAAVASLA
jgi:hypothetical protein